MRNASRKDILIAIVIIIIPILFYTYQLVPIELEQIQIGNFIFDSKGYETLSIFVWMINVKLLIIGLLVIWFITCKHWWRYVLFVPLIIELLKLMKLFSNSRFFDEVEYLKSLPFTIPIVFLIILLSRKMNFYSYSQDIRFEINEEIEELFSELSLKKDQKIEHLKIHFAELKKTKNELKKSEYLFKLLEIRRQFFEN